MIFLLHKTSAMRTHVPGEIFEPDQINEDLHEEFATEVSKLIANPELKELWDIEHSLDGKIADWWEYIAYCMRIAHVKILQKHYWRTSVER